MRLDLVLPHRHLTALAELVGDIGEPCWVSGLTVGALHGFDGFDLRPPFHLLTARDRNVRRIGHVVHTTHEIPLIDRARKYGLPVLSVTRALIDLARMIGPEALTVALDSAIRDGGTSEDFLHRRINALRTSGREGPVRMLAVLEGAEITRGGQSWLEREVLRLLDARWSAKAIHPGCARPARRQIDPRRLPLPRHTDRRRSSRLPLAPDGRTDEDRCRARECLDPRWIHPSAIHVLPGCRGRECDIALDPDGIRSVRTERSCEDMNRLLVSDLTETSVSASRWP